MNSIYNYISVIRPQQWFKNVVTIFGFLYALYYIQASTNITNIFLLAIATFFACLISSGNYVVNEIADKVGDGYHPKKKDRALVRGSVTENNLFILIILLIGGSLFASVFIFNFGVYLNLFVLFIAGIIYNIPPLRFKDIAFIDVISESINNPIRFLIGWFVVIPFPLFPPITVLLFFLFTGMTLMTLKRYRELKYVLKNISQNMSSQYRKSYAVYTPSKLLFLSVVYFFTAILLLIYFFPKSL